MYLPVSSADNFYNQFGANQAIRKFVAGLDLTVWLNVIQVHDFICPFRLLMTICK